MVNPRKEKNITEDDCPEHKSFKDDTHMQELGFVKPFACRQDTLDQNKVEYYSNPNKGKGFLCEHPYPQTLEKCKQNNWYRATREENMDGFCDKCSAIPDLLLCTMDTMMMKKQLDLNILQLN